MHEVLVDGAEELQADVRDSQHDVDTTNTALLFNAQGPDDVVVKCRAYDQNGNAIGRTATKVPKNGLRYLRASDLANGRDFIGSAFCSVRGDVVGSALLVAPGSITPLDVVQNQLAGTTTMQFPLVISF